MSSISSSFPGAACAVRNDGFFRGRRVMRAEASRRDRRFTLLEARRRIPVSCADEGAHTSGTAEDEQGSDDDAQPFTNRIMRWKQRKQLLKAVAGKQKAPFRPPSCKPSPLPALPDFASFRQRHLRYYDSIRHTFITDATSVGSCVDCHDNFKAAHVASKDSERPPWNDSTQLSFAPVGFQFQCQLPGSKRAATKAARKAEKGKAIEVKPNTSRNATGQQKETTLELPDFSFLFQPVHFSPLFRDKKVSSSQDVKLRGSMRPHEGSKNMPGVVREASKKSDVTSKENQEQKLKQATIEPDLSFRFETLRLSPPVPAKKVNKAEKTSKRGVLPSGSNSGSSSQDVKLRGSMRPHEGSKNMPGVVREASKKSDVTSKENQGGPGLSSLSPHSKRSLGKQANLGSVPADKENVGKCRYNLRQAKPGSKKP
ncbi:uncharacterized protein LOC119437524 isoform X2 [Dermacentor silvarum]|uniref:uncharacterized protein LOC119437524 isoform X2 n=1 Tax=Dermacentor silvarum TaxID=543639 RepID=UPI0021019967|nr:uncharacterized protein LOC119437524 isoform X2 [Dermacentor silvarum]